MKNLLVPIDFSINAINAAKYAAALASFTKHRLILFHSFEISVKVLDAYNYISDDEYLDVENKELLEDIAIDLIKTYPQLSIQWTTAGGNLTENMKKVVDEMNIDLIVMGTKGASGMKEIFMGSNTSNIIENIDCPVLAIPGNVSFSPLKKILYATDFHFEDFQSIKKLCSLSNIFKAEVIVAHISSGRSKEKDLELLDWFMELAGPKICCGEVRFTIHENKDFFEGINNFIKEEDVDLVSVSTIKKTFFYKIFGVQYTKTLSCHLQVPLLAFHMDHQG